MNGETTTDGEWEDAADNTDGEWEDAADNTDDGWAVADDNTDASEVENSHRFVQLAVDKKPAEFSAEIETALYDRVRTSIDGMRSTVASSIFTNMEKEQ